MKFIWKLCEIILNIDWNFLLRIYLKSFFKISWKYLKNWMKFFRKIYEISLKIGGTRFPSVTVVRWDLRHVGTTFGFLRVIASLLLFLAWKGLDDKQIGCEKGMRALSSRWVLRRQLRHCSTHTWARVNMVPPAGYSFTPFLLFLILFSTLWLRCPIPTNHVSLS